MIMMMVTMMQMRERLSGWKDMKWSKFWNLVDFLKFVEILKFRQNLEIWMTYNFYAMTYKF